MPRYVRVGRQLENTQTAERSKRYCGGVMATGKAPACSRWFAGASRNGSCQNAAHATGRVFRIPRDTRDVGGTSSLNAIAHAIMAKPPRQNTQDSFRYSAQRAWMRCTREKTIVAKPSGAHVEEQVAIDIFLRKGLPTLLRSNRARRHHQTGAHAPVTFRAFRCLPASRQSLGDGRRQVNRNLDMRMPALECGVLLNRSADGTSYDRFF